MDMLKFVYWKLLIPLLLLITGLYWAYSLPHLTREVYEVHYSIHQKPNEGFAPELPDILGIPPVKAGLLEESFDQLEVLVWLRLRELGYELPEKGLVVVNPPTEKWSGLKVHLTTSAADHLRLQEALSQALGVPASSNRWHCYTQVKRLDWTFQMMGRSYGVRESFEWQLAPDTRPQAKPRTFLLLGAGPDYAAEFLNYPARTLDLYETSWRLHAPEWELRPTLSWYAGRAWYLLLGLAVVLFTLVYVLFRPLTRAMSGRRKKGSAKR